MDRLDLQDHPRLEFDTISENLTQKKKKLFQFYANHKSNIIKQI